jgi:hypothetical protein
MPTPFQNDPRTAGKPQTEGPESLSRAPRTPEGLIAIGAEFMAEYAEPESGLSARDVVNYMLELFDNPTAIEEYEREMERRRGGRDPDSWH